MKAVRAIAMKLPGAEEGVSCGKCAFKTGGKAFLFMGMDDHSWNLLLKLSDSLPEASALAAKEPQRYGVGSTHWVSVQLPHTVSLPAKLAEGWIHESFRLLAPKKIAALLSGGGDTAKAAPKKKAKR
jgi:predicted DNA-binding protein (MmcQ/YjbR family)